MLELYTKIFITVAFLYCLPYEAFARTCDDCQLLTLCPGAVYLAVNKKNSQTEEIIKKALCSSEPVDDIPMVCCSDFDPAPDEIDNHENLKLLPQDCGRIEGNRIIGGDITKLYEFPWMVLISYNTRVGKEFLCGGSLINSRYVLTAAHCVKNKKIAGVRIGDHDWASKVDCEKGTTVCESNYQDIAVSERIIHPAYQDPPIVRNDIALLRLRKPVNLTLKNAGTICLPITQALRDRSLDAERATVAGWGLIEHSALSTVLRKVTLPVRTEENCKYYYNRNSKDDLTKNILCAGELGKDSCKGDSGGPLMLEGKIHDSDKFIQHGIVSFGPSQCGSTFPAVYTDVSRFMKWILDTIE